MGTNDAGGAGKTPAARHVRRSVTVDRDLDNQIQGMLGKIGALDLSEGYRRAIRRGVDMLVADLDRDMPRSATTGRTPG